MQQKKAPKTSSLAFEVGWGKHRVVFEVLLERSTSKKCEDFEENVLLAKEK